MGETSLVEELSRGFRRRVTVVVVLLSTFFLGLHFAQSFWQKQELEARLRDAVANSIQESVRNKDLVSMKRILQAFGSAVPDAHICLRKDGDIISGWENCTNQRLWRYEVPLTGEEYWIGVSVPGIDTRALETLPLIFAALAILWTAGRYLKLLAASITADLTLLLSEDETVSFRYSELRQARAQIRASLRLAEERLRTAAFGEVARQVAHDIRSPLAALEVAAGDAAQLPEDKRILVRSAVARIRDIANSLLDKQNDSVPGTEAPGGKRDSPSAQEDASPRLLSSLIESLVTEKRLQFSSRSRVEIEAWLDASSYGIFARVQHIEFERLLSNLINNAVESFEGESGAVRVNLSSRDGRAIVSVQDNGRGIPPEVLVKLGRRGETHGKSGGSGLGLHHARASAESWGGRLELTSEVGRGTAALVVLPQAPAPGWFVSELTLRPGRSVVILDDDASIHLVWQGRLESLRARAQDVEVVHASNPDEIRNWVKAAKERAREALYLMDYELLGYRETGLSLAEELGIGNRAILVTSRYEEPGILEGCRKLGARMIPKGLAGLVPIRIENHGPAADPARTRWDAVLIDDDPLARMTWKLAAERAGKTLRAFATAADFLKESDAIDRASAVYVDAELGEGIAGDAESLKISGLGFGEVYLATGYAPKKFAGLAHLRGVIGKEPPWNQKT